MSEIRILHTADVHLGSHFPSLGDYQVERQKDFQETFRRIISVALSEKVDFLFIVGDLFDTPHPSSELKNLVYDSLSECQKGGIRVIIIPGTHDHLIASSAAYEHQFFASLIPFRKPQLEKPVSFQIRDIPVFLYGLGYHYDIPPDALKSLKRRSLSGIHVGLLHGALKGPAHWKMEEQDFPFRIEDLASLELNYVALGHFHNHKNLEKNERLLASYPGSPEGKKFRESGPRYVNLVKITERETSLKKIPIQTKTLLDEAINLLTVDSYENLVQGCRQYASPLNIVRFTFVGSWHERLPQEKLKEELRPHFAYVELRDQSIPFPLHWIRTIENENTIRGSFVRMMQEKIKAASQEEKKSLEIALKEVLIELSPQEELEKNKLW